LRRYITTHTCTATHRYFSSHFPAEHWWAGHLSIFVVHLFKLYGNPNYSVSQKRKTPN